MALLFMDGFDASDAVQKWDYIGGGGASTTTPYGVGRSFALHNQAIYKNIQPSQSLVYGSAFMLNDYAGPRGLTFTFMGDSGSVTHIAVYANPSTMRLEIRRGSTVVATSTKNLKVLEWRFLEIKVQIDDASGYVEARIDGDVHVSFSGDTRNGGTAALVDRISVDGDANANPCGFIDDVYILDTSGTNNNDFLGDCRIHTLVPNANGSDSQLVGSDGDSINNYQLVNTLPYSSTTYVGSATVGQRDTYQMTDLPATATAVYGVQNNIIAAKNDATFADAKTAIRVGGVLHTGSARNLSATYANYHDIYDRNPSTSALWSISDVNGTEAGMEVA